MKILAIASAGGHWVQLLRLKPAFEGHELIFVSTKTSFKETVKGHKFYSIPDASRWNKLKLIYSLICVFKIVFRSKPNIIITTGAAPGLMGIIAGKVIGAKTIWIDSIANVENLSMSGQIATSIADKSYTQWPDLSNSKVTFNGNVLS
ncbi:oligosaccharide biosynthesis protein Alg14 [Dyadobacter luticola]|uniref:Oligosaccharide biosynthesis protein Alg14 n=1 Tax=Dyadobacter luticola TaxID=1979387 RepID=A0A5R9L3S3_9BACT|nr:oligosaccharide biosynthesis protein Alg14 [Dyadobacter luticola]TLV03232.1 oligosaccharide biosynthesis protein Alg14 [Dyadobacter luticola]